MVDLYPMRKSFSAEQRDQERTDRACFLHFLSGLLRWDPATRWTPYQTSHHPFLKKEPLSTFDEMAFEALRGHDGSSSKAGLDVGGRAKGTKSPEVAAPSTAAASVRPVVPLGPAVPTAAAAAATTAEPSAASAAWSQRGRAQSWSQSGTAPLITPEQQRQYLQQQQQYSVAYHPQTQYRPPVEPLGGVAAAVPPNPSSTSSSSTASAASARRHKNLQASPPQFPAQPVQAASALSSPVLSPTHGPVTPQQTMEYASRSQQFAYSSGHEAALPPPPLSTNAMSAGSAFPPPSPFSPLGSPHQRVTRPRQPSLPSSPARRPSYPTSTFSTSTYSTRPTNVHALGSPSHAGMGMASMSAAVSGGKRRDVMDEFDLAGPDMLPPAAVNSDEMRVLTDEIEQSHSSMLHAAGSAVDDSGGDISRGTSAEVDATSFADWDPFFHEHSDHSTYSSAQSSPRHMAVSGLGSTTPQRRQSQLRSAALHQQPPFSRHHSHEGGAWPASPSGPAGMSNARQRAGPGPTAGTPVQGGAGRLPPPLSGRRPSQTYLPPSAAAPPTVASVSSGLGAAAYTPYSPLSRSVPEHQSMLDFRDTVQPNAPTWTQQAQLYAQQREQQHAYQHHQQQQQQQQYGQPQQHHGVPPAAAARGSFGQLDSPTTSPQPGSSPQEYNQLPGPWYQQSPPTHSMVPPMPVTTSAAAAAQRHYSLRRGSLPANAGSSRIIPIPGGQLHAAGHSHLPYQPPQLQLYDSDEPLHLISPGTSIPAPSAPMLIGSPTNNSPSSRPFYGHPSTHASSRNPVHQSALLQYSPAGSYTTPSYLASHILQQQQPPHTPQQYGFVPPQQQPSPLQLYPQAAAAASLVGGNSQSASLSSSPSHYYMQQQQQQQGRRSDRG